MLTIAEPLKQQVLEASELKPESGPLARPAGARATPPVDQPWPESGPALPAMEKVRLQILEPAQRLPKRPRAQAGRDSPGPWAPRRPRHIEWDALVGQRGEELVYEHEGKRV